MNCENFKRNRMLRMVAVAALVLGTARFAAAQQGQPPARGQGGGGAPQGQPPAPQAPPSAKDAAGIDLTGYWVSVVTTDWRFRMVTPPKGDYANIPLNLDAKKVADLWDPAKDEAAGLQCKSYAAPALMRVPGRLHIAWQDDNTLKVETDAGEQTRLFHFGDWKAPANAAATWQGDSVAEWEGAPGRGARGGGGGAFGRGGGPAPKADDLKVVTTHLRPGYLRKNGVPYSDKTTLTEYWDSYTEHLMTGEHHDEQWLIVTSFVEDPVYLQQPYVTGPNFKKEPDGSKWHPEPCSSTW